MPSGLKERLGYLSPLDDVRLARAVAMGVSRIQLRLGPGFPLATDRWDAGAVESARERLAGLGLTVAGIGYYRNHLHPDPAVRMADAAGLRVVFRIAATFNVGVVSVFAGRDPERSVEENLPMFREVWQPLAAEAHDVGLKLAFENCTMYRGYPVRGINISHSPHAYALMFDTLPHPALGIEFDPSHCLKQRIDVPAMIRQFGGRILHVHLKDHEILPEAVQQYGSYDTRCSRDRFPGFGQVDFAAMFRALREVGYAGGFALEGEADPSAATEDELCARFRFSVEHLLAAWG